jgi:FixJ family two-component response regulator
MDIIVGQQGQNSTKTLNGKLRILFVTAAVAFLGLTQAATTADVTMVERERITEAGAVMLLLKPVNESELINSLVKVVASSSHASASKGAGLLSKVVPVEELKKALYQNLDKLDEQLRDNENGSLREIVHDLMGLSGLYGMTELRDMVLAFRADYGSLDAQKNLERVKKIRQHIEDFLAS